MRGNHKQLTLLTIITVITAFLLTATPAAIASPLRYINASYAATVTNTFLLAPLGFTNGVPNNSESPYYAWSQGSESGPATFTFMANGTGTATGTFAVLYYLNPNASTTTPSAGETSWSYSFTYTIAPHLGAVTINVTSGTFHWQATAGPYQSSTVYTFTTTITMTGTISDDCAVIILTAATPGPWSFTPDIVSGITPQFYFIGPTVMVRQ
jgi:hypothetical protein